MRQIELLCKQLYEAQDATLRQEAEKALVGFQVDTSAPSRAYIYFMTQLIYVHWKRWNLQESNDTLGRCQALLDRTDSSYAQLLAATTLSRLVSKYARCHWLIYYLSIVFNWFFFFLSQVYESFINAAKNRYEKLRFELFGYKI